MKKYTTFIAAVLLTLASISYAIEDTQDNREKEAERYMRATPPEDMFADMAEQMAKNLPIEERDSFVRMMTKHLDIKALEKEMKKSMIRHFTAKELAALADFYNTEEGKSSMKKMGVYMADVMPSIQAEVMKAYTKANREQ